MVHARRLIWRTAFIGAVVPFIVAAQAFPLPVQHEAETGSREAANAAHLARFDVAQFFKWLFVPFASPPKPATPTRAPVPRRAIPPDLLRVVKSPSLTPSPRPSSMLDWSSVIRFTFIDTITKKPITGVRIQLQRVVQCAPGDLCNPPVFFEGSTDADGVLPVSRSYFRDKFAFNFVPRDRYFISGPFQRIAEDEFVNYPYRFGAARDAEVRIELEPRVAPLKSPSAATPNQEVANAFLKAIEEARKQAASGAPQAQRQPSPEQIQQIIKLLEEAGRKAAANRPAGTPSPAPTPAPRPSELPLLPGAPTPAF